MLTIVCALLVVLQSTPATRTIADVVESGALFFELEITEFSVTR